MTPNKKKTGRRKKHKASVDTDASDHETTSGSGGKKSKSSIGNENMDVDRVGGCLGGGEDESYAHSLWGTHMPINVLQTIFQLVSGQEGALPSLVRYEMNTNSNNQNLIVVLI